MFNIKNKNTCKQNLRVLLKDYPPWSRRLQFREAGIVQCKQINKYNSSDKQVERQNCTTFSIEAKKAFVKIQHHFMIRSCVVIRDTRNIPLNNKESSQQAYSQHQPKWRKINHIYDLNIYSN